MNTEIKSFDGLLYICKTCDKKLKSSKVPCQAVLNKLQIFDLPKDYPDIRKLEKVLVAKRLLFKKITIIPKGQFSKVKGATCNVPIDNVDVSNLLPRQADNNGLMIIKLKRKLEHKGHVYFEPIRPRIVIGLEYLKLHNHLYKNVTIVPDNIPQCIVTSDHSNSPKEQYNEALETDENPLDNYSIATNETSMLSNIIEPASETSNFHCTW